MTKEIEDWVVDILSEYSFGDTERGDEIIDHVLLHNTDKLVKLWQLYNWYLEQKSKAANFSFDYVSEELIQIFYPEAHPAHDSMIASLRSNLETAWEAVTFAQDRPMELIASTVELLYDDHADDLDDYEDHK